MSKVKWTVNADSDTSAHRQIINIALFGIASGELEEGEKLPSFSELSRALKLNPATISKSYTRLKDYGVVSSQQGTGVFVKHGGKELAREYSRLMLTLKFAEIMREISAGGLEISALRESANVWNQAHTELYQ